MKILMFGRGVIATQYAWALEKAGHQIEFYVRKGRMDEYGDTVALEIYDARKIIRGELKKEAWNVHMTEKLIADRNYDLIFISVQHYHFQSVVDVLKGKIGKATVLVFNNFWNEPKAATAELPSGQLVYGFPLAGGGFDNHGTLKGSLTDRVSIGDFGNPEPQRRKAVMNMFKSAGFKIKMVKDYRSYLLSHFVFNAAIHLESVKSAGELALSDLFVDADFWRNVNVNAKELMPLLQARDVDLKANMELKIFELPPFLISLLMRIMLKILPPVRQLLTSHSNLTELKSYCLDVLITAHDLNIPLKRFEENKHYFQK